MTAMIGTPPCPDCDGTDVHAIGVSVYQLLYRCERCHHIYACPADVPDHRMSEWPRWGDEVRRRRRSMA